jgi:hypothetical protein
MLSLKIQLVSFTGTKTNLNVSHISIYFPDVREILRKKLMYKKKEIKLWYYQKTNKI